MNISINHINNFMKASRLLVCIIGMMMFTVCGTVTTTAANKSDVINVIDDSFINEAIVTNNVLMHQFTLDLYDMNDVFILINSYPLAVEFDCLDKSVFKQNWNQSFKIHATQKNADFLVSKYRCPRDNI